MPRLSASIGRLSAAAPVLQQLVRYTGASAAALAVDYGLMLALTEAAGLHYLLSSAAGFAAGAAVAYGLSVRFVFESRRVADRRLEFLLFVGVGLAALAVNQVLLWGLVERAGVHYAAAKVPVAGTVFLFNFALRRALLFTPPLETRPA